MTAAVVVGVLAASGPAMVQEPELGTRLHGHTGSINGIYGQASVPSARSTGRIMQNFARCVASRQPAAVEALLAGSYDGHDGSEFAGPEPVAMVSLRRSMPGCLGMVGGGSGGGVVTARVSSYLFRGMLAEATFERLRAPVLPAEAEVQKSYDYPWISKDPQQQVVDEMGACMAAWRPVDAAELLRTTPETAEERAAIGGLVPLMKACLRKDAVLRSSPAGLRSAIAIGLYHRAMDRVPAAIASKAN